MSTSSVDLNSFPLPPSTHAQPDLPDIQANSGNDHVDPVDRDTDTWQSVPDSKTVAISSRDARQRPSSSSCLQPGIVSHGLTTFVDGAASLISRRNTPSVDSALVDAISRSVAEQLRMLSLSVRGSSGRASRSAPASVTSAGQQSCVSQTEALKRFTKDLSRYADHTGARGKIPHLTPSSKSPETLHTVSALLPYQGEFRAAGLAVTSKEQARKTSSSLRPRAFRGRRRLRLASSPVRMSQVDGETDLNDKAPTSSTEVSFADPKTLDEWRYALIEEVPAKKVGNRAFIGSKSSWCWTPCATAADRSDHEHIQQSMTRVRKAAQQMATKAKDAQIATHRPSYIPMPPSHLGSAEPSPRHLCDTGEPTGTTRRAFKPTGRRRPSMTLARTYGHLPTCGQAQTHPYEEIEIDKHNPRAVTTQYLHPSAAVRPRASSAHLPTPLARQTHAGPSRRDSRLVIGSSLPELPSSMIKENLVPLPLRHTVGHLADRDLSKRVLVVRNPDEPSVADDLRSSRQPGNGLLAERTRSTHYQGRRLTSTQPRRPSIPIRASSLVGRNRTVLKHRSSRAIADRQVLRGLHVLASAACDEEVDKFVATKTGIHVRQFLASLVALESMWSGSRQSPEISDERARHRRTQMRNLKRHMRRSRQAMSVISANH